MTFELWNRDLGNLIGTFDNEDAALAAVRNVLAMDSRTSSIEALMLGVETDDGRSRVIAQGIDLANRATAHVAHRAMAATSRVRHVVSEPSDRWVVRTDRVGRPATDKRAAAKVDLAHALSIKKAGKKAAGSSLGDALTAKSSPKATKSSKKK